VLSLLHELVPKAVRVGVLVNPMNAIQTEATLREVREAAPTLGLQIQVVRLAKNVSAGTNKTSTATIPIAFISWVYQRGIPMARRPGGGRGDTRQRRTTEGQSAHCGHRSSPQALQ
jgi:hypothetical protein